MKLMRFPIALFAMLTACGQPPQDADTPANHEETPTDADSPAINVPMTPRREAPPKLTDAEKGTLGSRCGNIEPELYDAHKKAQQKLTELLEMDRTAEGQEEIALEAGLELLTKPMQGMSQSDHDVCVTLFKKDSLRKMFHFDPIDGAARSTLSACVKRVMGVFGKGQLSLGDGAGAARGPFCPGDFPVPLSLEDLPYESSADDWDSPTWKCLKFGLRAQQNFQFEYSSEGSAFACIARYLPRQGGAPIELIRDGGVNDEGVLQVSKKTRRQRMK